MAGAAAVSGVSDLIGGTPLVKLNTLPARDEQEVVANVYVKLESSNPSFSVKDRIAKSMILGAEARGELNPGDTIIEPTSGNTGIGLAMLGRQKGYKVILVMPDTMSIERRILMLSFGANVVLTSAKLGFRGVLDKADELVASTPNSIMLKQFANEDNPKAHYETTGPEIASSGISCDALVSGVGTGGTITGAGRFLRERNPSVQLIAVEPHGSPVLSGGKPGPHKIMGIGAGIVPDTLDTEILSEVVQVTDEEAIQTARDMAKFEGMSVGISSGAAVAAALMVGRRPSMAGKNIVAIAPSAGERYLSTLLFDEERARAEAMAAETVM